LYKNGSLYSSNIALAGRLSLCASNPGVACVGVADSTAEENGKKLGRRVAELAKKLRS